MVSSNAGTLREFRGLFDIIDCVHIGRYRQCQYSHLHAVLFYLSCTMRYHIIQFTAVCAYFTTLPIISVPQFARHLSLATWLRQPRGDVIACDVTGHDVSCTWKPMRMRVLAIFFIQINKSRTLMTAKSSISVKYHCHPADVKKRELTSPT